MDKGTKGPNKPITPPPPQDALITTDSLFEGKQWTKELDQLHRSRVGRRPNGRRKGTRFSDECRDKARIARDNQRRNGGKPQTPYGHKAKASDKPKKK